MRRRLVFAAAALSFVILLTLVIWQGSFTFSYTPSDLRETVVLWAVSTLIFVLMVTLAFMLFRAGVKLYIERQSNKEGSRIRSRLFMGAMALALIPVLFSVFFSIYVLNRTLDKWFSGPARTVQMNLVEVDRAYKSEAQSRVQVAASWISLLSPTRRAAVYGEPDFHYFHSLCATQNIDKLVLQTTDGSTFDLCRGSKIDEQTFFQASHDVTDGPETVGRLTAFVTISVDLAAKESAMQTFVDEQNELAGRRKTIRFAYILLDIVINLFVLFFGLWSAQILSRQISTPVSALLEAARRVRQGNLSYRIEVSAIDELATLVRAFNEMTSDLEANARELEVRRRFNEAILESIPTGVIYVSSNGQIKRVNRALGGIFPPDIVQSAQRLEDLFSAEDLGEVRYLMNRARRVGSAASQMDIQRASSILHLAITASSLEEQRGIVLVLEDTSDLLRAQKAVAWQEVARRIAHEIKNPLTPISLCADRIARQLLRISLTPETRAILDECTHIIQQEVQTVKSLVDEFAQFSRFPAAQPVPCDLNEIVESAVAVFAGRLENITVTVDLHRPLSPVLADREQIKRVIVNLIDNSAEAMNDSPVRKLSVTTAPGVGDTVELAVSDTGCGVTASDKEKLFLPYFSTKGRGTGLGLAIVSRIITEHHGRVRVEDSYPVGTRFVVELNMASSTADEHLATEETTSA